VLIITSNLIILFLKNGKVGAQEKVEDIESFRDTYRLEIKLE